MHILLFDWLLNIVCFFSCPLNVLCTCSCFADDLQFACVCVPVHFFVFYIWWKEKVSWCQRALAAEIIEKLIVSELLGESFDFGDLINLYICVIVSSFVFFRWVFWMEKIHAVALRAQSFYNFRCMVEKNSLWVVRSFNIDDLISWPEIHVNRKDKWSWNVSPYISFLMPISI